MEKIAQTRISNNYLLIWLDDDLIESSPKYPKSIEYALIQQGYSPVKYSDIAAALDELSHPKYRTADIIFILDVKLNLDSSVLGRLGVQSEHDDFNSADALHIFLNTLCPRSRTVFMTAWDSEAQMRWAGRKDRFIAPKGDSGSMLLSILHEEFGFGPFKRKSLIREFTAKSRQFFKPQEEVLIKTLSGIVESIDGDYAYVTVFVDGQRLTRIFQTSFLRKRELAVSGLAIRISIFEKGDGSITTRVLFDESAGESLEAEISSETFRQVADVVNKKNKA